MQKAEEFAQSPDKRTDGVHEIIGAFKTRAEAVEAVERRAAELKQIDSARVDNKHGTTILEEIPDGSQVSEPEAPNGLTEDEIAALLTYKSGGSYQLNDALSQGGKLNDYHASVCSSLGTALDALPPYNGIVYRNLSFDDFGGRDDMDAYVGSNRVGVPILYRAYTSSSTTRDGHPVDGKNVVNLIISSVNGKDLSDYGNNNEQEVLFKRGTWFLPTQITVGEGGHPLIYMEVVEQIEDAIEQGRLDGHPERNQAVGKGLQAEHLHAEMREMQAVHSEDSDAADLQAVQHRNPNEGAIRAGKLPDVRAGVGEESKDYSSYTPAQFEYTKSIDDWDGNDREFYFSGARTVGNGGMGIFCASIYNRI